MKSKSNSSTFRLHEEVVRLSGAAAESGAASTGAACLAILRKENVRPTSSHCTREGSESDTVKNGGAAELW